MHILRREAIFRLFSSSSNVMEHRHFYEEACLFIDKIWTLQNEDRIKYYPDGSGFCKSISCRFWLEIWVVKYCELHCILRLKVQCNRARRRAVQSKFWMGRSLLTILVSEEKVVLYNCKEAKRLLTLQSAFNRKDMMALQYIFFWPTHLLKPR